jgi:hypothetical protein
VANYDEESLPLIPIRRLGEPEEVARCVALIRRRLARLLRALLRLLARIRANPDVAPQSTRNRFLQT